MTVSLLIPSFGRPDMLYQCLSHIVAQVRLPDEIIVCVRDEDLETRQIVQQFEGLALRIAVTNQTGVVAAMNTGLTLTSGDIVALLDDDALPRRDWLNRIVSTFAKSDSIAGVGGLDVQENPDQKNTGAGDLPVGTFTSYGRLHGNHHLGSGPARRVHVLKGCNCAYRGDFLRRVRFDTQLRGAGAQVGWEISLGLEIIKAGGALIYDPLIVVDHKIAPRLDDDGIHRGTYGSDAAFNVAWNHFSIIRRKAPHGLRMRVFFWELLVGSPAAPGVLRIADRRIGSFGERLRRIGVTIRAFSAAQRRVPIKTGSSARNDSVSREIRVL